MTSVGLGGIAASVDLRAFWTGVRDQGSRPACLPCAASDGHCHARTLSHRLSAEYLFYFGSKRMPGGDHRAGLTFAAADDALRHDGQPDEGVWPYQQREPNPWSPPATAELWHARLEPVTDASQIVAALGAGQSVVLGIRLVPGFNRVQAAPHIIDSSGRAAGGHAVLVVGLGRRPGSKFDDLLMIRNSWGFGWGEGGYAWLPSEYLVDKHIGSRVLLPIDKP